MSNLAVEYAELSALATGLRWQAGEIDDHARMLTESAASGDIAQAMVIAPAEAAEAEAAILAAATKADLMLLELEARALAADTAATLYKNADEMLQTSIDAAAAVRDFAKEEWEDLEDWAYEDAYPWLIDNGMIALIGYAQCLALVNDPILTLLLTSGHWPTLSHEEAAAGLLAALEHLGFDADPDLRHDPLVDTDYALVDANGNPKHLDVMSLMDFESTAYNDHHPQVVLTEVRGEDGQIRYIVNIPGTDPSNLFGPTGLAGDLNTMADAHATTEGDRSELVKEVLAIMRTDADGDGKRDLPEGAEVMLSGHSLGGMAAASIASDPELVKEFNITALATQGSPVAHYPINGGVSVLSVEHKQDPVPQLDGGDNPDRTSATGDNWTTVSVDTMERSADPFQPHKSEQYESSMLNEMQHGSKINTWQAQNSEFFGTPIHQQAAAIHNR